MLELYRAEVDSHTQTMSEGLLNLEKDPTQLKRIEPLMRAAHSIKGAARIVGVENGVRVSHVMEDVFVAAQAGKLVLTSETIDSLLRGVDALIRIGSPDQDSPSDQELDALVLEIQSAKQGKPRSTPKPAPAINPVSPPKKADPESALSPASACLPIKADGNTTQIGLPAFLDARGAELLRQTILDQNALGGKKYNLDLSLVSEISLEGLTLLASLKRSEQLQFLQLTNTPVALKPLFTHTGFGTDGV